jgi:hypothetical protein
MGKGRHRSLHVDQSTGIVGKLRAVSIQQTPEAAAPKHGRSVFHLGHENAQAAPKHTPGNVSWRSARSNLIQGDLTLAEARTKFVELIARYFDLGEVRIEKE